MNACDHIQSAARELGLEDGYPYGPDDEPDTALASAHALIAIAMSLERLADQGKPDSCRGPVEIDLDRR